MSRPSSERIACSDVTMIDDRTARVAVLAHAMNDGCGGSKATPVVLARLGGGGRGPPPHRPGCVRVDV